MLKRLSRVLGLSGSKLLRMNCARTRELLPLHVAGDLPPRRAQAVAQHLSECAPCRAEAEEYAASRAWLQAGAQAVFADEFYDGIRAAVLSRIRQEQRPAPFFAPLGNRRFAYAAASVVLLCVVGALAWQAQIGHKTSVASKDDAGPAPRVLNPGSTAAQVLNKSKTKDQPRGEVAKRRQPRHASSSGIPIRPVRAPHEDVARGPQSERGLTPPATTAERDKATDTSQTADVARIEIQTADPNIRIIWLAPQPADAPPQKEEK